MNKEREPESVAGLVAAARSGNPEVFSRLVERFHAMGFGYAYSILGDFHGAEDAVQEAFIAAYQKLADLREAAAFPGWFRRIVFKHCDRFIRARPRGTVPLEAAAGFAASGPAPDAAAAASEISETLRRALGSLTSESREVVTLHYLGCYTQPEIATFLEVPLTTVKKRLHDSRRKLRERMLIMLKDSIHQLTPKAKNKAAQVRFLLTLPVLLQKGVPVLQALKEAGEQAGSPAIQKLVDQMIAQIRQGGALNEVLAGCNGLFPPMVVALVRDGEWLCRLDETLRMAGEWLKRGAFDAPPDLFTRMNPWVAGLVSRAKKAGAKEVILDSSKARVLEHGPSVPAFRAEFVMPNGKREEDFFCFSPRQMPGIERDLKQLTILDQHQRGDAIRGRLRVQPESGSRKKQAPRIAYHPHRTGLELRISVGR